jgi:adenosylhomocysteine nucleosidase
VRTVLLVAAERFELPRLPQASAVRNGYIAERNGMRWILVANGPGPKLAGVAADEFKDEVDALVSIGLCGGLDPELQVGDIFVATAVNGRSAELPRTARSYRSGDLVSEDRVAVTLEDKRRLWAAGASAVEMEAEAICSRAADWKVPFYCVRAVSDGARDAFELDLNAVRDRNGRFSKVRIIAKALRNPVRLVPELLRLKRNSEKAAKNLGEFVADCSF